MNSDERNSVGFGIARPESRIQIYEILWRRKWLISLLALVGIGCGYWYYLEAPREYQSGCVLLIKERNTTPVVSTEMKLVASDKMETQLHVIASQTVLAKASQDDNLVKISAEIPGVNSSPGGLAQNLSAAIIKGSDAMAVTFTSSDPRHATAALQAIIAAYEASLRGSYADVGVETAELIKEASDTLAKKIDDKRNQYADFRKKHAGDLLAVNGQLTNLYSKRMSELLDQRSSLLAKRFSLQTELEIVRTTTRDGVVDPSGAIDVLSKLNQLTGGAFLDQERSRLQTDRAKIELQQLTDLLLSELALASRFGEDHPKIKELREKIEFVKEMNSKLEKDHEEETKNKAEAMAGQVPLISTPNTPQECVLLYAGILERDLDRVSKELKVVEEEIEKSKKQTEAIDAIIVEDANFRETIEQSETLQNRVLARLDEIDIVKDSGGTRAAILNPPSTARLIYPVLLQVIAIGGLIGALLGVGIGYLLDQGEGTFRSPGDVSRSLEMQVLGQVPSIETRRVKRAAKLSNIPETIISAHQPSSSVSEAFRAIRTALYFSGSSKGHQVIQITSPTPGDGKSTLAANLAISIAKSGKRVLLIDADFRRPTLHKIFGADNETGLASILVDSTNGVATPLETEIQDLFLLPTGPDIANPSELLSSARMGETLELFRKTFDFVILDSPPVLAVTDPLAIAARVDGVILAIRISSGVESSSKRALEALNRVGATVLGVVVNGFTRNSAFARGVARDFGYGRGYGHGYGDENSTRPNEVSSGGSRAIVATDIRQRA